jgi:hypothetical protein
VGRDLHARGRLVRPEDARPRRRGDRTLSRRSGAIVGLLPVPMLAALVIVGAFADGHTLHLDARAPAVAVAGLLVARRAPFLLVICAAAATAAALRLVG